MAPTRSKLLADAIRESEIRYDPNGEPAIDKRRKRSRIDSLHAAAIAAGLPEEYANRPRPKAAKFVIV